MLKIDTEDPHGNPTKTELRAISKAVMGLYKTLDNLDLADDITDMAYNAINLPWLCAMFSINFRFKYGISDGR